ncbi:thiamine phosphate synthase [Sphingobacterium thalpophilum]|uniref:thiamine phosphate synthase n=1 Tax=Sphingobacterium thalpophilum TaxID=259 RepID=UPI003C742A76
MIIALTAEETVVGELEIIPALFEQGLDLLHLRKYHFTDAQMCRYIASIGEQYHSRLVLHSHPHLSAALGIYRVHINEQGRSRGLFDKQFANCICSTSVHQIQKFNTLEDCWDYAFLSPVFPSISKSGYGERDTVLDQLAFRSNFNVNLIALGGITATNCLLALQAGVDGIALLGSLWCQPDPIQNFILCKETLSQDYNIFHRG